MAKVDTKQLKFKDLTKVMLKDLITEYCPEFKKEFIKKAYPTRYETVSVPQFDANGKPLMKYSKKRGEFYHVHKKVETTTTKEPCFNLTSARTAFKEYIQASEKLTELFPLIANGVPKPEKPIDIFDEWK